jgi:nucleoside phosphorylase
MGPPVRRIAFLAPMRSELRPLVRRLRLRPRAGEAGVYEGRAGAAEVVAATAGIGTRAAARAAERVLAAGPVDLVVVVGVAGGVGPRVALGALIVPERVVDLATGAEHRPAALGGAAPRGTLATSDALIADPAELARLEREGVVALDMETAAVAAVCERRGRPWAVFRAISDRAGDPAVDPAVLALVGPDGRPDLRALARFLLPRPWRALRLARLGRDLRRATHAAAAAAVESLAAP